MKLFDRLLRDGHSLLVIEHHPLLILAAHHVVELGPGAGEQGGQVIFEGSPKELKAAKTPTGRVLSSSAP